MIFHNPLAFGLIPFAIVALLYAKKKSAPAAFRFSAGALLADAQSSLKVGLSRRLYILRIVSITLIIFAFARPQSPIAHSTMETEGIDIMLVIDSSTSMRAQDFTIGNRREDRINVVKEVVKGFIGGRRNDRIGLIAFAGRAYTVCPLTLDYNWLIQNVDRIKTGMIEDGTAIGSGISAALNRLKNTRAESKIIILLTDGRSNAGNIPPLTAAQAAKALHIKVYTIGAGSKGLVPYPVEDLFGNTVYQQVQVDLDEDSLMKIASATGGKYFRATDTKSLKNIYQEIDGLEKTPIEYQGYMEYKELFPLFLIPGLAALLLEVVLGQTYLRKVP